MSIYFKASCHIIKLSSKQPFWFYDITCYKSKSMEDIEKPFFNGMFIKVVFLWQDLFHSSHASIHVMGVPVVIKTSTSFFCCLGHKSSINSAIVVLLSMITIVLLRNCQILELYGINISRNDETKYLLQVNKLS